MENNKNSHIKEMPNLIRRKTKRPIIVQDIDSENENSQREEELEFENLNLNFERYCYLCHKEVNIIPESHSFFQCKTCNKYYHRDCYKEYKLKQTEKELCKNIKIINKCKENNNNGKILGKECILCIMENNYFCTICKKRIDKEKELIIQCELCGNLMHYKCLDVPLYFIFYREFYKNIFFNYNIKTHKYKEFLLKIKELNNKEVTKELISKIFIELKLDAPPFSLNYLFYVCHFCKTRNLYDLQEINVYKSTSFSKVNFYNTTLNPLSQNINKVKSSWNMNKLHELYISSSNPYNDALFDKEKYDSNYIIPKPMKIIKKFDYNRINNIIINDAPKNNKSKQIFTEEEICELSNIVQMFENDDKINKENKKDTNKKNINNDNKINDKNKDKEINEKNNNNNANNIENQSEKMDVVSENIDIDEINEDEEKSKNDLDKNIIIRDRSFYLIKWDTYEYSLELDSFMEAFPNFERKLTYFIIGEKNKEKEQKSNYTDDKEFNKTLSQILKELDFNLEPPIRNLINNSFIFKQKDELIQYKKCIVSIITKLLNDNYNGKLEKNNNCLPHILIINDDNSKDSLEKLLENNKINYLNLLSNRQTFIYECINFNEVFSSHHELNILKINNNIYLNKNKENILQEDNTKRYVNQAIIIDDIDSKNLAFMQEYYFDLIIFDLKNEQSLLKLNEFFKKINSPLNINYTVLKYVLIEQQSKKDINNNNNKIMLNFFNLFYNKEDTILLYGNYSGKIKSEILQDFTEDEKENLRLINIFPSNIIQENEEDLDPFFHKKNFINLNYSTLLFSNTFNVLNINNVKWALYLDKKEFHYTQILSSLITKYDMKVFSVRSKDYNEIIMNFIPIYLDKETFIQYLHMIKNKPEVLLKTQENKKDLMQNILLLCSLPSCMTKFYKKYLEDYKLPIKDNINISKIDVFYQLSRILLKKTKGKIIIIFPMHDKVFRDNEPLLRKIRREIEKIFFSNINPENKEINLNERKKNFFCFLMDEDGLFEEIRHCEKEKYPVNIIIFNMFLQNKSTGEFFNLISNNKYRHKIILYQLYISNLIEGKLSQVFFSKLNQFIEICTSPLKKMKTTVYGQLTLIDKEIITIADLKKMYEKELSNLNEESDINDKNDISKVNIVTSYKNLINEEKKFDGFIHVEKNSYLICTNSDNINLRYDNIYNTFVGNVSFNNYENNAINFNKNENDEEIKAKDNNINIIKTYNDALVKYKKKKFYQELDFLKDESNFENIKANKYDLNQNGNNETNQNGNNNIENNLGNNGANLNMNITLMQNGGNINHNNTNNHLNASRGEEVYILNDSTDNYAQGQKRKKGRKKKNENNNINTNNNSNNGTNNINNNRELIQIQNEEENEEANSIISEEARANNNKGNNLNLNDININNKDNNNTQYENIPVNLDEITEDYSDTFSENSQERANMQNKLEEEQPLNNINNKETSEKEKINKTETINNKDQNNQQEINNNEKTYDIIKSIANSILSKRQNINDIPEQIPNLQNLKNSDSETNQKDIEQIEQLINETKLESSRDRLFKIYNYLLTKGFEEKTRKLFVKCLLNYGFPLVNEFDKFYLLFQMNAQHLKIKNIPNKTDSQLYYELIYFILEEDESLDYNIFAFGDERTSLIRTKLLIIRQFQSFKDVTKAMYHFVKDKNSILFGHIEPKLDESYQRVHFVMAKLLSNIVSKSIKSGFLNYKNYIKDDNIIFDNIRIKKDGQTPSVFNIREGIAKKIFGKTMNENEFNDAITTYYEALFVQLIKVPDSIMNNNNDNSIR